MSLNIPAMTPSDHKDRYRVLLEASRALSVKLSPDELHEAIYRETAGAVEAPRFYLALHDQSRDLARIIYYADRGKGEHVDLPYHGSNSHVITAQKGSIVSDGLSNGSLMSLGGNVNAEAPRSGVTAPLMHDGRILGAISAQSYEPDAYGQDDLDMLEGLARVAAVAIYNSMQFAELDRRRKEAELLEKIGRELTSRLDPDQVLRRVTAAVSEFLHVDGVAVWLRDKRDPSVWRVAHSGGDIALPLGLAWPLTGYVAKVLIDEGEPIVFDGLSVVNELPAPVAEHLPGGSAVGHPLILGGQVEGILTAGSRQPRRFSGEDVHVLQRLASQAALALGNARLHASLHELSLTDPLTGLPNRRRLQLYLDHEVAAAQRGRPMGIVFFDIDKFKHYNDTFGHIVGDDILRELGKVLAQENRAMNIVARYGGDEFVSVLSDTGTKGAKNFGKRVTHRIAEHDTLSKFGISVSFGCAEFDPATMASVNDILRAADSDMQETKALRHADLRTAHIARE
jgi:diguanylate cyclase (GGDEF)-like protein